MKLTYSIWVLCIIGLLSCVGCKKEKGCTDPMATNYNSDAEEDDGSCEFDTSDPYAETKSEIKETYAEIVYASYVDSYDAAVEMRDAIDSFVANPTEDGFDACKEAWLAAREPYGQTEAYRFAGGPIDDEDGPEGLLNAWPMDESYVDYVTGDDDAGIINDPATFPSLEAIILEGLNEVGGEENVAIGYHAIEFLLWGQDNPDVTTQQPGMRPYTDFLTSNGTAENQTRRAEYLQTCADLLLTHLQSLIDEWNPNGGAYYNTFMALDNNVALQQILTGIGTLSKSELAGERIFVALDNQDQEDEHSCFSDNTHRDIILNAVGISNVYNGEYQRTNGSMVSGTSIADLLEQIDADLHAEMATLSANSVSQTTAIPVPFDYNLTQETTGGTGPIMTSILTLQEQGDKIVEVGTALGVNISNELPE